MKNFLTLIASVSLLVGACAKKANIPAGTTPLPKVPASVRQNPSDADSDIKTFKDRQSLTNLYPAPAVIKAMQAAGIDPNEVRFQFVQYTLQDDSMFELVEISSGYPHDEEVADYDQVFIRLDFPVSKLYDRHFNLRYLRPDLSEVNIGMFSVARKDRRPEEDPSLNGQMVVEHLCTQQPGGLNYSQRCEWGFGDGDLPTIYVYNK